MISTLYGRDGIFDRLIAPLVGLAVEENRRLTISQPRDTPAILLAGGRGMGKSAVLEYLAHRYGNRAPIVFLDLEAVRFDSPAEPDERSEPDKNGEPDKQDGSDEHGDHDGPGQSDRSTRPDMLIAGILRGLVRGLEPSVRWGGDLRFPRYSLALLAITTLTRKDLANRQEARKRLAKARHETATMKPQGRSGRNEWTSDLISEVISNFFAFPLNALARATFRLLSKRTLEAIERKAPLNWYKDYDRRTAGDGYDALVNLAADLRSGHEDFVARANQALVAAFLADITAEYQGLSRLNRPSRPVLLLDNVQSHAAGIELLRLLLESRRSHGGARDRADPLVAILTWRGNPGDDYKDAARVDVSDLDDHWQWEGYREKRNAGLLLITLSRLSRADILQMLDSVDPRRLSPDLAHLIYRLTGGHPMGADVITRAVATQVAVDQKRESADIVGPASLLSLPAPGAGGEPVWLHLLRRLIPAEDLRLALPVLAAARDAAEAHRLARLLLQGRLGAGILGKVTEFLGANGWGPGSEYLISDSFIRVLLLYALYRSPVADPRGPTWQHVHAMLRDYHENRPAGTPIPPDATRLYHYVAEGNPGVAVRRFCDSFNSPADAWLKDLTTVASVPCFGTPDNRRSAALGTGAGQCEGTLQRSVSRLFHAAWYLQDPLVTPDAAVIDKLADELRYLAGKHPTGSDVLFNASRTWPAYLRRWQQGPDWLARKKKPEGPQ